MHYKELPYQSCADKKRRSDPNSFYVHHVSRPQPCKENVIFPCSPCFRSDLVAVQRIEEDVIQRASVFSVFQVRPPVAELRYEELPCSPPAAGHNLPLSATQWLPLTSRAQGECKILTKVRNALMIIIEGILSIYDCCDKIINIFIIILISS